MESGFFYRIWAIFMKELTQMRRDKFTFAMMFGIPIMQLMLFGYAINTDPKHLPTAIYAEQSSPIIRSMMQGLENSDYFDITLETDDPRESADLLASGKVAFVISFPPGFTEDLVRGERPQVLVEADASDPSASSAALGRVDAIFASAIRHDLSGPLARLDGSPPPYSVIIHAKYNPEGATQYNIVPGLLGVILTMTLVMITGMAMTREEERGTMENLLALPARPAEVMIGKISPYLLIGVVQTVIILIAARTIFGVPFAGSLVLLVSGIAIFVVANLALGFTFSTIAKSQMQAMQLTFFFFLPSLLLSGFMFPFRGMPIWAQIIGEVFPLTHFLRVVRGVMLKGVSFSEVQTAMLAMCMFIIIVTGIAMLRYRRTLD